MKTRKHTPGPWHITLNHAKALCVESDGHRVGKHPGNIVAVIASKHKGNAHLVSAAPELLEELENLVRMIEDSEEATKYFGTFVDQAQAVISKAKGVVE